MEEGQPLASFGNSPMESYGGSINKITNPQDLLDYIEINLRNLKENDDGSYSPVGKPLMNDDGVNAIMGILRGVIAQNSVFSNLESSNEIHNIMGLMIDKLVLELMIPKYAMKRYNRDRILLLCIVPTYMCLKRAYKEGEKKFWKGSVNEIINRNGGNNGGLLSKLNIFGG